MVMNIRRGGGAINKAIISALIVTLLTEKKATHLLKINGGSVDPNSPSLITSIYKRYNLVQRRATSTRKQLSEAERGEKTAAFIRGVQQTIDEHGIIDALVINYDETCLSALPSNDYTMEVRGAGTVKIAGKGDKRNISGVVAASKDGTKLDWQVIYKGKTDRSHADKERFPAGFDITHSANRYVDVILLPYVKRE
jgi:hypothetical protein